MCIRRLGWVMICLFMAHGHSARAYPISQRGSWTMYMQLIQHRASSTEVHVRPALCLPPIYSTQCKSLPISTFQNLASIKSPSRFEVVKQNRLQLVTYGPVYLPSTLVGKRQHVGVEKRVQDAVHTIVSLRTGVGDDSHTLYPPQRV